MCDSCVFKDYIKTLPRGAVLFPDYLSEKTNVIPFLQSACLFLGGIIYVTNHVWKASTQRVGPTGGWFNHTKSDVVPVGRTAFLNLANGSFYFDVLVFEPRIGTQFIATVGGVEHYRGNTFDWNWVFFATLFVFYLIAGLGGWLPAPDDTNDHHNSATHDVTLFGASIFTDQPPAVKGCR